MSKDKCPECGGTKRIFRLPVTALGETSNEFPCPTCNGTGEKKLDSPREKIRDILDEAFGVVDNNYSEYNEEITNQIIAFFPDIEELEKQVRLLKESDFAEIPYASKLRKVQLDGGQFVYENILRLIRKMEGGK